MPATKVKVFVRFAKTFLVTDRSSQIESLCTMPATKVKVFVRLATVKHVPHLNIYFLPLARICWRVLLSLLEKLSIQRAGGERSGIPLWL